MSGGFNPTGTVTFDLYNNSNGAGTPLFTDANVALVNGTATSAGYTATVTGTDYWVATYNGDANNSSVTSGIALEPIAVTPATPTVTTSPTACFRDRRHSGQRHCDRFGRLQPHRNGHLQPL